MKFNRGIFLLLFSLTLIVLAFVFQQKLSEFRSLGLLGIFLINLFGSATVFLPAPAIATVVAGGIIYPPLFVATVSSLGSAGGELVGYLLGKSGKAIFVKNHHRWHKILKNVFKTFGGLLIFIFSLVPNPLFDGIGILAGVLAYPPYLFFLFAFLGRLTRDILLAFLGSAIGN